MTLPKPRDKKADDLLKKLFKLRAHIVDFLTPDIYAPHHPEVDRARGEVLRLAQQGERDIAPDDFAEVREAALEILFKLAPARCARSDPPPK